MDRRSAIFYSLLICILLMQSSSEFLSPSNENSDEGANLPAMLMASRHLAKVAFAARCSVPRATLVAATSCYPHLTGSEVLPSSTLLHECSEASGCCGLTENAAMVCGPNEQELVRLPFRIREVDGQRSLRRVESLVFWNHTQCTCLPRPPGMHGLLSDHLNLCPNQKDLDAKDVPRR